MSCDKPPLFPYTRKYSKLVVLIQLPGNSGPFHPVLLVTLIVRFHYSTKIYSLIFKKHIEYICMYVCMCIYVYIFVCVYIDGITFKIDN